VFTCVVVGFADLLDAVLLRHVELLLGSWLRYEALTLAVSIRIISNVLKVEHARSIRVVCLRVHLRLARIAASMLQSHFRELATLTVV
jgi:hypothetical protein